MNKHIVTLYRQMSTPSLLQLRAALLADQGQSEAQWTKDFVTHRLAVIAAELHTRGHVDTPLLDEEAPS